MSSMLAYMAAMQSLSSGGGGGGGGFTATGAAYSDGSSGNYLTGSSLDLSGDYTIEGFMKVEGIAANDGTYPVITQRVISSEGFAIGSTGTGGSAEEDQAFVSDSGGSVTAIPFDAPHGTWRHFALVVDSTNGRFYFYVDGMTTSIPGEVLPTITNSESLLFFRSANNDKHLEGFARSINRWDFAMTWEEVWQRYHDGAVSDTSAESYSADLLNAWASESDITSDPAGGNTLTVSGTIAWDAGESVVQPEVTERSIWHTTTAAGYRAQTTVGALGIGESFSAGAWINKAAGDHDIVCRGGGSGTNANGWSLYASSTGRLVFYVQDDSGNTLFVFTGLNTITNNTWQHVAASWDGGTSTATLYVNGTSLSYTTNSSSFDGSVAVSPAKSIQVGYQDVSPTTNGRMCDAFVCSGALSASDIAALSAGRISDAGVEALDAPPVVFYRGGSYGDSTFTGGVIAALVGPDADWIGDGTEQRIRRESP